MFRKLLLPLVGNRHFFPFSYWILRQARTLAFGNLWDFHNNGELEAVAFSNQRFPIRVFVDVGANTGAYFQAVSPLFTDQSTEFHLFEPSPQTFSQLVQASDQGRKVIKNQLALGKSSSEKVTFFNHPNPVYSGFHSDHLGESKAIEVEMTTIDLYATNHEINQIDFLKLDVEGHEFDVLLGAKTLLKEGKIKAIQFEFGVNNLQSRTYFKDFFDLLSPDFDLFLIQRGGLIHLPTYEFELEAFGKVSNFLAIQKSIPQS